MEIIEKYKDNTDSSKMLSLSLSNKHIDEDIKESLQEEVDNVLGLVENYNERVINWCNEDGHYFQVDCEPYSKYSRNNLVYMDDKLAFYVKVDAMYLSYRGTNDTDDPDEYKEAYSFFIPLWRKVEAK